MHLDPEFDEFNASCTAHEVRFPVVGGRPGGPTG
jgi:hypothetical protein